MTTAIAVFDKFDSQMQEFKKRYDGIVYDLTDPEQENRAKADKLAIGKVINKLDAKHKEKKTPLKEEVDLLDGERKRIKDDLLDIQGNIKDQLASHKQEILDHAIMLNNKVLAIVDIALDTDHLNSNVLKERIVILNEIDVDDTYELRKADATLAKVDTLKKLEGMLVDRIKYEEGQAELERLRAEAADRAQKDREEQIRKDAAAEAKADSERERLQAIKDKELAEKATQDAIEAGKRQKEAAEQRAEAVKEEAEAREKIAAQTERDRIEQKRLAGIEAAKKRENNKKHHAKINNEALTGITHLGVSRDDAINIVTAVAKGMIPHITIAY
jgi:hypothetical protein